MLPFLCPRRWHSYCLISGLTLLFTVPTTQAANYYFNAKQILAEPIEVVPESIQSEPMPPEPVVEKTRSLEIWDVLRKNLPLRLDGAYFETASAKLSQEARYDLLAVATFASVYPEARLTIAGHTDFVGDDLYNRRLSEQRARSVQAFLVQQGVAAERMSVAGYGEDQPIADNNSTVGRAKNRRVEIRSNIPVEIKMPVTD